MISISTRAFIVLTFLATTQVLAATPRREVVDSVNTLRTDPGGFGPYITITCYYAPSNGSACAGGGDFDERNASSATPGGCDTGESSNGATILFDHANNCYYRRNFGLNGVVDARQCGVVGDGLPLSGTHPDDGAALITCLKLATSLGGLGSPYNLVVVNTGGGVILDQTHGSLEIPANVELTCGGVNVTSRGGQDFRIYDSSTQPKLVLTNAIVLQDLASTISMDNPNSALTGCLVEEGTGASNENIYSPSVWYPNCRYQSSQPPPPCDDAHDTVVRSALVEANAFYHQPNDDCSGSGSSGPAGCSIGITVTAPHATVRNVTVLGFGTCLSETAANTVVDHFYGDCNDGLVVNGADAPIFNHFDIRARLTGGNDRAWNIVNDGITETSGGHYSVAASIPSTDFVPQSGDTVWVATGGVGGAESARGRWTVGSVTCSVGTCTLNLNGSKAAMSNPFNIKGDLNTVSLNGVPATAITNIQATPANLPFVAPGQSVEDSVDSDCLDGLFVKAVWPARATIYLTGVPRCSGSGRTIQFTDDHFKVTSGFTCSATTGDVQEGCLIVNPSFRFGDGLQFQATGGAAVSNCIVFDHMVSYHLFTGSNNDLFNNCSTGSSSTLPDRNLATLALATGEIEPADGRQVSLLINGANFYVPNTNNLDACDISWSNSVLGQHRPVAIVMQSNCTAPDKLTDISMGIDNAQLNGITVEVDGGGLALANGTGNSSNFFVADGPTLKISNNGLKNSLLWLQDNSARRNTIGCGNLFFGNKNYVCSDTGQANGQVYLSDVSTTQLKLCPSGGDGLVINGLLTSVPDACTFLSNAGVANATNNYVYAATYIQTILDAGDNGSGIIRLTLGSIAGLSVGDYVDAMGGFGTVQVDGTWQIANLDAANNTVDLVGSTWHSGDTYLGGGNASYVGLVATTDGHTTVNGIEVSSVDNSLSLAGIVYPDSSGLFQDSITKRDVASWYNRRAKSCKETGLTPTGSTSSTTYVELDSSKHCEFVTWGDNDLLWSAGARVSNNASGGGAALSVGFDGTTGEAEEAAMQDPLSLLLVTLKQSLTVAGNKSGLSEGKHYVTALGKAVSSGSATFDSTFNFVEVRTAQ